MAERTAWRTCPDNGQFSRFGKKPKRGKGASDGPSVHDDLVKRDFTADAPKRWWLADIAEHRTGEGKVYVIDSQMKSGITVSALNNAVARRGEVARSILHTDRGSQFRSRNTCAH